MSLSSKFVRIAWGQRAGMAATKKTMSRMNPNLPRMQIVPGSHMIRSFSSQAGGGDDLGSMSAEELRNLVRELRGQVTTSPPQPFTITEVPEGYLRPTKGESSELKNITIVELQRLRDKGVPITMVRCMRALSKLAELLFDSPNQTEYHAYETDRNSRNQNTEGRQAWDIFFLHKPHVHEKGIPQN